MVWWFVEKIHAKAVVAGVRVPVVDGRSVMLKVGLLPATGGGWGSYGMVVPEKTMLHMPGGGMVLLRQKGDSLC